MLELINTSVYLDTEHALLPRRLVIAGPHIVEVSTELSPSSVKNSLDLKGLMVIPGLIDLHLHGANGVDTMDGTHKAFRKLAEYEASCGITSLVPTTMTMPFSELLKVCSCFKDLKLPESCSRLLGLYLEGPYLNAQKCGAQNLNYLETPSLEPLLQLDEACGHQLKFVALAPELPDALDTIRKLSARRIRTTLAHTACTYAQAYEAMLAGANHVTHLYNAMPPLHHRETGPIGACMDYGSECELICDGYHLSAPAIRAVFKLMDPHGICFISDSMRATGLPEGEYELGGQPVTVRNRQATLADGTLAGSATNLYDCMCFAVKSCGIPLCDAIRACTLNPAEALREPKLGRIRPQSYADLLLIDEELKLHGVMLNGTWLRSPLL